MRPQCAILFAAAIVLAVADVSATINAKSIQTGDVPINRLLRSETSVDVDEEERGGLLEKLGLGNFKLWGKTSAIPNPAAADAATKLDKIKGQLKTMVAEDNLKTFFKRHYREFIKDLIENNINHDARKPMSVVREIVGDDKVIMKAIHGLDNNNPTDKTGFVQNLQESLYDEWIRTKKHLDSVKKDVQKLKEDRVKMRPNEEGKGWTEQYEETVQSKIDGLSKLLDKLREEKTNLVSARNEKAVARDASKSRNERKVYGPYLKKVKANIQLNQAKIDKWTDEQTQLQALLTPPPEK